MPKALWSESDEKKLLKVIGKATEVAEALSDAKAAIPHRNVTSESVGKKLARLGMPTLTEIVAKNSAKAPPKKAFERAPRATRDELAEHRMRLQAKELEESNERLVQKLHDLEKQNEQLRYMRALRPVRPVVARKGRGEGRQRQGVPVMLCSDWHVEEPVDAAKVNGLNRYDLEIADKCIDTLAESWEWMINDRRYDCREGVVWLGGDHFSGHIHEELVEKNFLSPVRASAWLLPRMEKMLRRILANSPRLERLIVPCNDGNHGRLTKKIRIASRTENSLEWFLFFNLAERMKDEPRIQFQIAEGEYNFLRVFEQNLCFFHGDSIQYQGGVGGVLVPMKRGLNELRKYQPEGQQVDVFNVGHFHTYLNHGDVVVNGSMIGVTPYGMSKKFTPEPRRQAWYMLDSTRGKCLSAPIWLPKTGLI